MLPHHTSLCLSFTSFAQLVKHSVSPRLQHPNILHGLRAQGLSNYMRCSTNVSMAIRLGLALQDNLLVLEQDPDAMLDGAWRLKSTKRQLHWTGCMSPRWESLCEMVADNCVLLLAPFSEQSNLKCQNTS